MSTLKLKPVTDSTHLSVVNQDFDGPAFIGPAGQDYVCPHCGNLLASAIREDSIFYLAIQCWRCKKLSSFPPLPKGASLEGGWLAFPVGVFRITATIPLGEGAVIGVDAHGQLPPNVKLLRTSNNGGAGSLLS